MSKIGLTVEQINAMEPTAIVRNDNVRDKFIQIYEAMWTPSTGTSGEAAYERESRNFNRLLSEKEDVRKTCTKFSLFTSFLDVAISGLTLDPGTKAQAYLLARSVAVDSYYDNGQKKTSTRHTACSPCPDMASWCFVHAAARYATPTTLLSCTKRTASSMANATDKNSSTTHVVFPTPLVVSLLAS